MLTIPKQLVSLCYPDAIAGVAVSLVLSVSVPREAAWLAQEAQDACDWYGDQHAFEGKAAASAVTQAAMAAAGAVAGAAGGAGASAAAGAVAGAAAGAGAGVAAGASASAGAVAGAAEAAGAVAGGARASASAGAAGGAGAGVAAGAGAAVVAGAGAAVVAGARGAAHAAVSNTRNEGLHQNEQQEGVVVLNVISIQTNCNLTLFWQEGVLATARSEEVSTPLSRLAARPPLAGL